MIGAGAGYGILPCFIGVAMPNLTRLLAGRIIITRTFWLVVHRNARRIARIERFIDWLGTMVTTAQPLLGGAKWDCSPKD